MKPLIYIAKMRLPTEKAHGYQIFKTIESFLALDQKVILLVPRRFNSVSDANLSAYYNLDSLPRIVRLPCLDLLHFVSNNKYLKSIRILKLFTSLLLTFSFTCICSVFIFLYLFAAKPIIYTRDINIAWILKLFSPFNRLNIFVEVHSLSENYYRKARQAKILKTMSGVITMTNYMLAELQNDYNLKNIISAPDAVDTNQFKVSYSKRDARNILKLPSSGRLVMYVGKFLTLSLEKGIPEIIEAISLCLREFPDLKLYLVGGPISATHKYKQLEKNFGIPNGVIHYYDKRPVQEIPLWNRSADILLMPHPNNPFYNKYVSPLKLFEYMCSKAPIIASNLPAIREVLVDKKNSILISPDSPLELSSAIQLLLKSPDLSAALSDQAFEDVNIFTWRNRAAVILNFIDS